MPSVLCPRLIGRDDELATCRAAIDQLPGSAGQMVVVSGEAGIGKSRLLREVVEVATRRNLPVLTGRCVDSPSPPPFRPLTEALFSHLRTTAQPELEELGPFRRVLARLVPEWGVGTEAAESSSSVVLGEALLRLLRLVGKHGGCVLALEDLQWADAETVDVLEYLSDNVSAESVLIVATLRLGEPGESSRRLQAMVSRRAATSVSLRRLASADVDAMGAACLGTEAVSPYVRALLGSIADGVPFLVEEVLASAVEGGELRHDGADWVLAADRVPAVPPRFVDMVARRIGAHPDLQRVMAAAAMLDGLELPLLAHVCEMEPDHVSVALWQAVEAQLVSVSSADAPAAYAFRHALTREAVLARLPPEQRTDLAVRALAAVESAHPGLPGEECGRAASLAEKAGLRSRAAELWLEVGLRALGQGALATAGESLTRARDLAADPVVATKVDEVLCETLALAGDNERLADVGDRLLKELTSTGASSTRVAAVHFRRARVAVGASQWGVAEQHLDAARSIAGREAKAEESLLAAQLALGLGQTDRASELARVAKTSAERSNRFDLACEALEVLGRRERQRDLRAAEDAFASALVLAESHGLGLWRVRALHELGTIDLLTGAPVDRLAAAREAALDAGALSTAALVALQMAAWYSNHVELEPAVQFASNCAAEARRLQMPIVAAVGHVVGAASFGLLDDRQRMEELLAAAQEVAGDDAEIRGTAALQARAGYWLVREDRRRAAGELDAGMDLLRPTGVTAPMRGMWALVRALDDRGGQEAIDEVEASGLTSYWLIRAWIGHARAVELGRAGDLDAAQTAFAAADKTLEPCEWHRQHARRLVAEAAIADGWGDPGEWLRGALALFDHSGHEHIASACRSLLRRAGAPVPRRRRSAKEGPAPLAGLRLTARELEVLALLADACPTREIAGRLFLSPKTVERHIANVATKVGVSGRAELIAFAAARMGASSES